MSITLKSLFSLLPLNGRAQSIRRSLSRTHSVPTITDILENRTLLSTITVNSIGDNIADDDEVTLREAIDLANLQADTDSIEFAPGISGTILLSSELQITDDLTINGPGADVLTISGGGSSRIVNITSNAIEVSIRGLAFADGFAQPVAGYGFASVGGAILNQGAKLQVADMLFEDNFALSTVLSGGGAIANLSAVDFGDGGSLKVKRSTFLNNVADGSGRSGGGAILNEVGSTAVIKHSQFTGNVASSSVEFGHGGAVFNGSGSTLDVSFTTFEDNIARGGTSLNGSGGAIFSSAAGFIPPLGATILNVHRSDFIGNQAIGGDGANGGEYEPGRPGTQGNGGAIAVTWEGAHATVSQSNFIENSARGGQGGQGDTFRNGGRGGLSFGGAVYVASASLEIRTSRFLNNTSQGGTGGTGGFVGNGGLGHQGHGGAIAATALLAMDDVFPYLQIDDSLIQGNQAIGGDGGDGGGLRNGGNASSGNGGGVSHIFGTLHVTDTKIIGNRAIGGQGGLRGSGDGTIGGQGGFAFGGGIRNREGTVMVSGSVISGNQAIGGIGGEGNDGGSAYGGGIDSPIGTFTLLHSLVTENQATGGSAGTGGNDGTGIGGGIATNGNFFVDAMTTIAGNHASTSHDDVFGPLLPLLV